MPTSSGPCEAVSGAAQQQPPASQPVQTIFPERVGHVWLVLAGSVDLFLQKMKDGEYGARHYITSVEAGQVLLGIDLQQYGGISLVAVPQPGTQLQHFSSAVFFRRNTLSRTMPPSLLLEEWIHALSSAARPKLPPREAVAIPNGADISASEAVVAITADQAISWVRLVKGQVRFCGAHAALEEGAIVPLSRRARTWLALEPGSAIIAEVATPPAIADVEGTTLRAFHAAVLACLIGKVEEEQNNWQDRMREQQRADGLLAYRSLKGLTAPLSRGENRVRPGVDSDPFLSACRMLEPDLGIIFKPALSRLEDGHFQHGVEGIASASSVRQRQVMLRDEWWKQDCGPLLAQRKADKAPLALVFRTSGHYESFDPAASTWTRINATTAAALSSAAYLFYRRFPLRSLQSKELLGLVFQASGRDLGRVLVMGTAGGILSLAFPITVGLIFDSVIPGAERSSLWGYTALLIVATLAGTGFSLVRSIAVLRVEARIDAVAQAAVWDRLLRLPAPFFRRFSSGDLAIRSLAINQIRVILTNSTLSAMLSGLFSLFNLALLFFYSVRLAWLAVGLTVLFMTCAAAAAMVQLRFFRQAARIRGRISAVLLEFMNGVAKLRVSGAEDRAFAVWASLFSQQKTFSMQSRGYALFVSVLRSIYPLAATTVLFYVASPARSSSIRGVMSTGSFLAFLAAFVQFISSSVQFTSVIPSVISVVPVFERLLPILEASPEVDEARSAPGELKGAIEVSQLSFRYDASSSPILKNVSFQIRPGEFVAFTGPSGSGKSTLLRLLLGFEQSETGSVSFDDQNIDGVDVQALRRQIGVVLQSGRLVSGTILDNIIGSLPLSHEEAWEAARMAGLDHDIKAMPMGMHTFVNDGGAGLSGGQRQRLMIARAIVSKPRILLFDEATSALDNHTQAIVSQSLETLQATRIVIAHRLSTIQNADRIYVFDKGSIVQTGTYAELKEQQGLFRTLVQRQVA